MQSSHLNQQKFLGNDNTKANDGSARWRRKASDSNAGGADSAALGGTSHPSGLATRFAHANGNLLAKHSHDFKEGKKSSKRRKARSLLRRLGQFADKHSWALPLVILAVFLTRYALDPTERNPVHHFIFLSYKIPQRADDIDAGVPARYAKGGRDFAFVAFYTVVLSFTREFVMQELLRPLARMAGMRSRGKQARFMEQMYTALYFGSMGPWGVYIMAKTPGLWYFRTLGFYEAFPHKTHEAMFKFYYLFQAAYWAQQAIVLVLGQEKRRKDFKELVCHHIVSLALIWLSYRFHFTHIGLAIYITHDISDFFLATSKTLNYINSKFQGPYFFVFMCVWIYLRHCINLRILYSILTEFRTVGPYELNWETQQYKCWISNIITFGLLAALQALNLFWLFYILRIAYRFIILRKANDDRSEADESEDEEATVLQQSRKESMGSRQ